KIGRLWEKTYLVLNADIADLPFQDPGPPAGGINQAHQDFQGCGLARAIGSQKAEDFSFADFQVQVIDGSDWPSPKADPEGLAQCLGFQNDLRNGRRHHGILCARLAISSGRYIWSRSGCVLLLIVSSVVESKRYSPPKGSTGRAVMSPRRSRSLNVWGA